MMKLFRTLLFTLPLLGASLATQADPAALKTVKSQYNAVQTVDKIKQVVTDNHMKLFALIDHQAAAKEAGLNMPFATVIIFGNPKAGTPMMLKAPTLAIDLPVKALVWEDQKGDVFVTMNDTDSLGKKHGLTEDVYGKLKNLEKLIPNAVAEK